MNQHKPVIGELYLINDEAHVKRCLVPPEEGPAALGHVYQCVKYWDKHDVYEYHRVIMREDRFYPWPRFSMAMDGCERPVGQALGHKPTPDDSKGARAGEPHNVIKLYAALVAMLFTAQTQAFLKTIECGEILRLESDDNGTPFPAGGVFVYDNYNGKLTLGRRHEGRLVKKRVAISALRNVTLASIIGAPPLEGEPRLLLAGDFVGMLPFFERSLFQEGPSRTLAPFAFVERTTRGECMRTKYHLAMQDSFGQVHRGVTEDPEEIHWLC